ncbi:MAG TPA: L,D-transpeptidase [bacterium]|nr:L,D-transpeptidase [bacterium]
MKDWRIRYVVYGLAVFFVSVCFSHTVSAQSSDPELDAQEDETAIVSPADEAGYYGPRIKVNIPARQLFLYDADDKLLKVYDIAVGKSIFPTPVGKRWIDQIVWNPWWIPPNSYWAKDDVPTPPGPTNPLGPVKMKMGTIMFHGNNKDSTIGVPASHGCMRMHNDQAAELARYLQESVTDLTDSNLFKEYKKNSKRSYYVNLTTRVPVEIVYELVEIRHNTLFVYQDVYSRVANKASLVEKKLLERGYDLEDVDIEFISKQLKITKNSDLSFDLPRLMVRKRGNDLSQLAQN